MTPLNRFILPLAAICVFALGACAPNEPARAGRADRGYISAGNAYPGGGVIQAIEVMQREPTQFRFVIRMNDGGIQTITHDTRAGFSVGEHVRIVNGYMERR